jgi:hemin uptake protein HemP
MTAADAPDAPDASIGASPLAESPGPAARTVASEALFRGATELRIDHGGVIYRLKLTALGKLILTK